MIIFFEGPRFFAATDEDHFFGWLAALPGYKDIRGSSTTLGLTLDDSIEPEAVLQLLVIFRRWQIDITPLLPLRSPATSHLALWDTLLDGDPRSPLTK